MKEESIAKRSMQLDVERASLRERKSQAGLLRSLVQLHNMKIAAASSKALQLSPDIEQRKKKKFSNGNAVVEEDEEEEDDEDDE